MKTLIFNGSPRENGDTVSLIQELTGKLTGEVKIIDTYRAKISPCLDCRYCWENQGCSIHDEMQEVYAYIQECDNILIASPLHFSELTGKLLEVGSRLQTYFCASVFRKETPIIKPKRGAVLLIGGADRSADTAYRTACLLLHEMNCQQIHELVYCRNTDKRPALEDKNALIGLTSILDFFNTLSHFKG